MSTPAVCGADPTILVVGDSLSAGYGMKIEESWVSLLQNRLMSKGYGHRVVNASISGDTTQGGLARLPRALARHEPSLVIIELGGNDGLRGIPVETTRRNLDAMIAASRGAGASVLVTGIRIPPNYGRAYTQKFEAVYKDLADTHSVLLIPFFMRDVVFNPELMQADGIHPNAEAQTVLLDTVWQVLEPALSE